MSGASSSKIALPLSSSGSPSPAVFSDDEDALVLDSDCEPLIGGRVDQGPGGGAFGQWRKDVVEAVGGRAATVAPSLEGRAIVGASNKLAEMSTKSVEVGGASSAVGAEKKESSARALEGEEEQKRREPDG